MFLRYLELFDLQQVFKTIGSFRSFSSQVGAVSVLCCAVNHTSWQSHMQLDGLTLANLNIVQAEVGCAVVLEMRSWLTACMQKKQQKGSLLWLLSRTQTAFGARLVVPQAWSTCLSLPYHVSFAYQLRKWVTRPLVNR